MRDVISHVFPAALAHWGRQWKYMIMVGACLTLWAGCGDAGPEVVPVHGRVTFDGKNPPGPGTVYFAPLATAEGVVMRPGSADFERDGNFRATAFRGREGLVPATYRVQIVCWKRAPDPTSDLRAENYVPNEYRPPDLTVESGEDGPIVVEYDVTNRK
jgi:hypothetical protein